jgi:hypothetical protein
MVEIDIVDLLKSSGDAQFIKSIFQNNLLTILLKLYDDSHVKISIKTDTVFSYDIENSVNPVINNCRVDFENLENLLAMKNGYYIPPSGFGEFMKDVKKCYNLAYGKKISDISWLFSIKGYEVLVACIVRSAEDILVSKGTFE